MVLLSSAWCGVGEAAYGAAAFLRDSCEVSMKCALFNGFTLFEMFVALTVAAILTTVSLNVYAMFAHGMTEASVRYERFAGEHIKELRCRTRFVRGISLNMPPCDSVGLVASRIDLRTRF